MDDGRGPRTGERIHGPAGERIGRIDAVFADYLLVRSGRLLPVDLYVPRAEVREDGEGRWCVERGARDAYAAWHRPLRQVSHDSP